MRTRSLGLTRDEIRTFVYVQQNVCKILLAEIVWRALRGSLHALIFSRTAACVCDVTGRILTYWAAMPVGRRFTLSAFWSPLPLYVFAVPSLLRTVSHVAWL